VTLKEYIRAVRKSIESEAAQRAEKGEHFVGFVFGSYQLIIPESIREYFEEKAKRLSKKMTMKKR